MNMLTTGRIVTLGLGVIVAMFLLIAGPMMVENLDAAEVMVIQAPISGQLTVYTEPGWKWQGFGDVQKYPRRKEFKFTADAKASDGLQIRFYDGGHAYMFGSVSWEMPLDPPSVIEIHKSFRSPEGVENQAIRRAMESAAYFSGPTMSSLDSAAGRRNELLQIINDQMLNGVYKTISKTVDHTDPVTGVKRQVTATEIVMGNDGQPIRAQESYVKKFNVRMLPLTVSQFKYDDVVESQIKTQQQAINQVTLAVSNAKKAEQDVITTEKQGQANAAKAKWEQEVENAKTIATAQARVTIADAAVKEAEAFKKSEILRGEGEAKRKQLVMEADGQLDKKLEAIVKINSMYADAISKAQPGAWAPAVQMGSGGKDGGSRATDLVDLMTAKTAKELGVDLGVKAGAATKK